jgi:hypothetical protein
MLVISNAGSHCDQRLLLLHVLLLLLSAGAALSVLSGSSYRRTCRHI